MKTRILNLLTVKSIVTILLTAAFAYLSLTAAVSQEFMLIYTTVIAFYFGTQNAKTGQVTANDGL